MGEEHLNDFCNISLTNIELMKVSVLQRGIKEIINNKVHVHVGQTTCGS